jgi:hypothetical protein
VSRELEKAYRAVVIALGAQEADRRQELTEAFVEELLNHLPDIDNNHLVKCIDSSNLFILSNTDNFPSRAKIRSGLNKFIKDCHTMEAAFDSTSPSILYILQCGFSLDPNRTNNEPTLNINLFITYLKLFLKQARIYAEEYLETIPRKGPRKDLATNHLIEQLAQAYEATTGNMAKSDVIADSSHKGFHGKFFELVLGCTKALGKQYQSNEALGERIRRVLNMMAKKM